MARVNCILVLGPESSDLEACLESIFAQRAGPVEVVLVDDTPQAHGAALAARYAERLLYLPNGRSLGLAASRNRGIAASQADFVAFLECPNRWAVDKLAYQLEAFEREPKLEISLGSVEHFGAGAVGPSHTAYLVDAMLCRRSLFDRLGLFNPQLQEGAEAQWFMEALTRGVPFTVCPETVLHRKWVAGPAFRSVYQEMQQRASGRLYQQAHFRLPAGLLRVEVENLSLLRAWSKAWAPYAVHEDAADLTLRVFDDWEESWGVPFGGALLPPRHYAQGLRSAWDATYMASQRPALCLLYDLEEAQAVGGLRNPNELLPTDIGKPLELLLLRWLAWRQCQVYHASVVAWQGRGILLVGHENSGKSTVMAACLEAGWDFVADDLVVLRRTPQICAQGVYAGLWLESQHARRFPLLSNHLIQSELDPKGLIYLSDVLAPGQLLTSAPIQAVVCPQVSQGATAILPGSRREALMTLVASSFSKVAGTPSQARLDLAAEAVTQGGCFTLQLGESLEGLSDMLREALQW